MAVIEQTLADTQRAFDNVAVDYDRSNARNAVLCAMRRRFVSTVAAHTPAGGRILDLGCGPGADEETLAGAGFSVTAIDWSAAMVDETKKRLARAGLPGVDVHHLGIQELDHLPPALFDTVCSNFGPLNCVPSLPGAVRLIAERVRPGGRFIASVIGRVCPWEMALYAGRGDWTRLAVRFARDARPVPLNGQTVWTRYYTPGAFARVAAGSGFELVSFRGLGVFVPPPYLDAFAARHPALVARLQQFEDLTGGWPGLRNLGDHFLMVMRKA